MLHRNSEQLNINNVHFGVVKSLKIRYFRVVSSTDRIFGPIWTFGAQEFRI